MKSRTRAQAASTLGVLRVERTWETLSRAVPRPRQPGPESRAVRAINEIIDAVRVVTTADAPDRERASALVLINRALAATDGRDWTTHAAMALVDQVYVHAMQKMTFPSAKRPRLFERAWPEFVVDEAKYIRAVETWIACERGKRANRWGAVADVVDAAGLGERSPASLKRQWRSWFRRYAG